MSFDLKSIKKTKSDLPPRTLIYGEHKVGKTTFAAGAPSPILIQTEDGSESINIDAFPLVKSWNDLLSAVASLYQESHEFKTLILDSLDWAERLAHKKVVEDHFGSESKKSIEDIGYGKGYVASADLFSELLDGLNAVRADKKMHIVLICHSEIRRFDDPLADSYDRYQIKLHKQSAKLVQEYCDVIGYAALGSVTKKQEASGFDKERVRAIATGQRVLHLDPSPAFAAGNRYGLPSQVNLDWTSYENALTESRK